MKNVLALGVERLTTPIGTLLVATDEHDVLRALSFEEHEPRMRRFLELQNAKSVTLHERKKASAASVALERYFSGDVRAIEVLRVQSEGTPFQRHVWRALREIPVGATMTYGELAQKIGYPAAVRAVGAANGANPIPVVVPCHRVIGSAGKLTGYGGGIERKKWLLRHEGVLLV